MKRIAKRHGANNRDRIEPLLFIWSRNSDFGAIHPTYIHSSMDPDGRNTLVATASRKSNKGMFPIERLESGIRDNEQRLLKKTIGSRTIMQA